MLLVAGLNSLFFNVGWWYGRKEKGEEMGDGERKRKERDRIEGKERMLRSFITFKWKIMILP